MRILDPTLDLSGFFARLADAPARALLLDYDGTLAPFRQDRHMAVPYPGVREALMALAEEGRTRLAIVSGRPAQVVPPLLGLAHPPEIWGSHGMERLSPDGTLTSEPVPETTVRTIQRMREWIEERGWGDYLEPKPFGVALHGRGKPPEEFARVSAETLVRFREDLARADMEVLEFAMGVEVRPSSRHKGEAVDAILAEVPAGAVVAYLGDDRTDEDAFRALRGRGLSVLVREEPRETAAALWLRPPWELLEFLEKWRLASEKRDRSC